MKDIKLWKIWLCFLCSLLSFLPNHGTRSTKMACAHALSSNTYKTVHFMARFAIGTQPLPLAILMLVGALHLKLLVLQATGANGIWIQLAVGTSNHAHPSWPTLTWAAISSLTNVGVLMAPTANQSLLRRALTLQARAIAPMETMVNAFGLTIPALNSPAVAKPITFSCATHLVLPVLGTRLPAWALNAATSQLAAAFS